jgi:hypothetical protein
MVNELKALGWVFTYIDDDHDVEKAAQSMGVTNILNFDKSRRGTDEMFAKERKSRGRYYDRVVEKRVIREGDYFADDNPSG